MKRREVIALLCSAAAAWPCATDAQPAIPGTARVGVLSGASLATPANAHFRKAFVDALRQRGWEEGKNLVVELRAGEGRPERFAQLAAELVALNVDVAVGSGSQGVQALKAASASIPIVMLDVSHPIEAGSYLRSLGRAATSLALHPSWMRRMRKPLSCSGRSTPRSTALGFSIHPAIRGPCSPLSSRSPISHSGSACPSCRFPFDTSSGVEAAFEVIDREGLRAVQVHPTPIVQTNRQRIAELFIERRIPTVTGFNTLARDGILMSYGSDQEDSRRGATFYVDRILRGAKPADLPVERPIKFLLSVNLKTARAIGLTIPATLLARADEVI